MLRILDQIILHILIPLASGWFNLAGDGNTPEAFAAQHWCIQSMFTWDGQAQEWRYWFRPPDLEKGWVVNTIKPIEILDPERGYWMWCEVPKRVE